MEPTAMTAFLSTIGEVFTQAISWVASLGTTIVSTPILLLPFALAVVSKVAKIFKRLILRR